jgi:hypothetical protein
MDDATFTSFAKETLVSVLRTSRKALKKPPSQAVQETEVDEGILHPRPQVLQPKTDKPIILKKGLTRPHIHRYSLRIKTNKPCTDDEQQQVQATLQKFWETVFQADSKTIIPPYLELDRGDKNVIDISSAFPVASVDSFHALKKYFFRMSSRNKDGLSWCSVILALSTPFSQFIEKVRYSLENQNFSLWPKASDNENAVDIGWLLYSTRHQDEERLAAIYSQFTGYCIGVNWKPIRTSSVTNRKKDPQDTSEKVNALHVECAIDKVQEVHQKLSIWYDSVSTRFPDGTKMRLVPTYNSILAASNKSKFASCLARQAALSSGIPTGTTWEMLTNLFLDKMDPVTGYTFRDVIMSISPTDDQAIFLFHSVDKQWRSDNVVTFTFRPKHEAEARSIIAGLVPFLRDEGYTYFLHMISAEAQARHASSRWNSETRQVSSVEEEERAEFLSADDNLNLSNKPTMEREHSKTPATTNTNTPLNNDQVKFDVPQFTPTNFPFLNNDTDSVSTFHPNRPNSQQN